tara:strand:+ start:161 stop:463 length:303 start_codon:yes stop_codon:yes gene_type:complete
MCFPSGLDYCAAQALVLHEMVHARQFCSGNKTDEGDAYIKQCNLLADQQCEFNKNTRNLFIRKCVKEGKNMSLNKENVKLFQTACASLINEANNDYTIVN